MIVPHIRYGFLLALVVACGGDRPAHLPDDPPPHPDGERGRVVFLGTSLTAGLGLDPANAYPALIQAKIDSAGLPYTAVNAGVSGETSAGALRRIDWLLQQPVGGAGDRDRRERCAPRPGTWTPCAPTSRPSSTRRASSIRRPPSCSSACGPRPTWGPATPSVPAGLPGAGREERNAAGALPARWGGGPASLNQCDMIHPTAQGQRIMAETVWRVVGPVLEPN